MRLYAEATRVYAEAFNKSPQAVEFYGFFKTLETYKKILLGDTSIVLSTDSDLFRLLKSAKPAAAQSAPVAPARPAAPAPVPAAQ